MEKLEIKMAELPNFHSFHGASNNEITAAEERLDVKFAPDYVQYLKAFGAASVNGHELTGICVAPRLDVVTATNEGRDLIGGDNTGMYVIERIGIDGAIAWQSADGAIYLTLTGKAPRFLCSSLLEFVQR